ncbi:Transcriptional regulator, LysR family protein [Minicystis rosea]|nr:Transcriptional regulator, LysR family protein [Minicystis rosea]
MDLGKMRTDRSGKLHDAEPLSSLVRCAVSAPLHGLTVFVAVAEAKSFRRAARILGLSASAVSQAVRSLESYVGQPLLARTSRSVALTDAGRALLEAGGPAVRQARAAIEQAKTPVGAVSGTVRLSVPRIAARPITEVVARLAELHPHVRVEVYIEDRLVDLVDRGLDAGVRLNEAIERDMVQVRLHGAFRFLVVGAPSYLARHGTPKTPADLDAHRCIGYRFPTTGGTYAWELERGEEQHRLRFPWVTLTDEGTFAAELAERGVGLAYVAELSITEALAQKRLVPVLERWAPEVPGLFIYFPSRAQVSPALRALLDVVKPPARAPAPARARRRA